MFKLVQESLEPQHFQRGLDPKHAMGIGKYAMIKSWLDKMGIEDYIINDDYTIDVDGDVYLNYKNLDRFPDYIQFGKIKGYFTCSRNNLTSLEGAPKYVHGSFYCSHNELTSLRGAPKHVKRNFYCDYNQLTSLEGGPNFVGISFHCDNNQLTSLEGAPNFVGTRFWCDNNAKEFTIAEIRSVSKTEKGK